MGMSFDTINGSIGKIAASRDVSLSKTLSELGESPGITDVLKVQQDFQMWSMAVQMQSSISQQFAQTVKDVVNKI